jgi:hypothetical protein
MDDSQSTSVSRVSATRACACGNARRVCAAWLSTLGANVARRQPLCGSGAVVGGYEADPTSAIFLKARSTRRKSVSVLPRCSINTIIRMTRMLQRRDADQASDEDSETSDDDQSADDEDSQPSQPDEINVEMTPADRCGVCAARTGASRALTTSLLRRVTAEASDDALVRHALAVLPVQW